MDAAGAVDRGMADRACDFLTSVADERGAVPIVLPSIASYPRANHWGDGNFPPGLGATLGIAGLLHKHGVEHPWRGAATTYCLAELEGEPPKDAHVIREALTFLEHAPDAHALEARVTGGLRQADWFKADPAEESYGLGPLEFAPAPSSRWRELFSDQEIEANLDHLAAEQQDDGGWPLSWEPPSEASVLEWRGIWTLKALRVLRAYGRC